MYSLLRPLIFQLPPETAHNLTLAALKHYAKIRPAKLPSSAKLQRKVMGLDFPNPIGLAAGLDKNADCVDGLATLGFGFLEVGTITPRPQPGNPKPRLFRLPESEAIINRMGFNNKGVAHLVEQVQQRRYRGVLGINIGKNFDTPVENAVDDYLLAQQQVHAFADYVTINISSPNTPGLRTLQQADMLRDLLQPLRESQTGLDEELGRKVPLVLKIAPDLSAGEITMIADVVSELGIDGLIATNTTLDRSVVEGQTFADEAGGLSGKPVFEKSTQVLAQFRAALGDDFPLIAAGGIDSVEAMQAKLDAGADLVQVYSGLIYQGPGLIRDLIQSLQS